MTEHREIEFISADWMNRAACWPGLQVYSRPVRVPIVDCPQRRKTDIGSAILTVDEIEPLPGADPLNSVERLLKAYDN